MALALIAVVDPVRHQARPRPPRSIAGRDRRAAAVDAAPIVSFGLIVHDLRAASRRGFATATEISAFAALYALVVGGAVFRELGWRAAARSFVHAATRSGLVLFIVAAAQSLAFVLTLQQVPHAVGDAMVGICRRRAAPGCSCCCRSRS